MRKNLGIYPFTECMLQNNENELNIPKSHWG